METPPQNVAQSISGFRERREALLRALVPADLTAEKVTDPVSDLYGERAVACLVLGRFAAEANARLRHTTGWFDRPHPTGRKHKGECDFAAMKLCRAYYLFRDTEKLEPSTVKQIVRFFLTTDFESMHGSENHHLLFRTSRYLMAQALPDERFKAYGKTGRQLQAIDRRWLTRFIRFRARRGWGEFDSSCYFRPDWECLTCLHDYAQDPQVRHLAEMMLDLLLVDMAVDSLGGLYAGAHGRIYEREALDHAAASTYPLQYLYFGNVRRETIRAGTLVDALVSSYRPKPLIVDIALNRPSAYENRERKHLHNTADVMPQRPIAGSIRKVTWYTPHYVLGTVNRQDPYPPGCPGAWYAHHEQHNWDLTIGTRTRSRLFTHHPGNSPPEHGYWTGDIRCCCGHFFQHRQAVVALYDIPEDQPHGFIHAWLPRDAFGEVLEEGGWIFVREAGVVAALRMVGGHQWTTDGPWKDAEVQSPGRRNGAVCEVGLLSDFGSFEAFRRQILSNTVAFDPQAMTLTYRSKQVGSLAIDTRGKRQFNGRAVDLDYPTYDCPWLKSAWDSGVVLVTKDGRSMTLDFRASEDPER